MEFGKIHELGRKFSKESEAPKMSHKTTTTRSIIKWIGLLIITLFFNNVTVLANVDIDMGIAHTQPFVQKVENLVDEYPNYMRSDEEDAVWAATASNDYTLWKQGDAEWNTAEAWPASQYPSASLRYMSQAGCVVTSIAMLLRHHNVITADVSGFNPWICNERLKSVGAFTPAADLYWSKVESAFPGLKYVGQKSYSLANIQSLYSQGYACVIQVLDYHYVALKSVSGSNVEIMDPGYNRTNINSYSSPVSIIYYQPVGNHEPEGWLDMATGGSGTVEVSGWVFDRDDLNANVKVHVYIGGPAGSEEGEGHEITADKFRDDVERAYPGVGNYHGFDAVIETNKRGSQPVYVYGLDVGTFVNNPQLNNCPQTVSISGNHEPEGWLDIATDGIGTVEVSGWVFDRDDLNANVKVHVYIGGPAGSEEGEGHEITADKFRDDVERAYPGVGNYHGFDAVIETNKRGSQPVYVYGLDVGTFVNNPQLGNCPQTVNIIDCRHQWNDPTYKWNNTTNTLTLRYICKLDSSHEKAETQKIDKVLRIPSQLKVIEAEAFTGLPCQVVIIPEGCTTIGTRAFADCKDLIYVKMPNSIKTIAADAFSGCSKVYLDYVD